MSGVDLSEYSWVGTNEDPFDFYREARKFETGQYDTRPDDEIAWEIAEAAIKRGEQPPEYTREGWQRYRTSQKEGFLGSFGKGFGSQWEGSKASLKGGIALGLRALGAADEDSFLNRPYQGLLTSAQANLDKVGKDGAFIRSYADVRGLSDLVDLAGSFLGSATQSVAESVIMAGVGAAAGSAAAPGAGTAVGGIGGFFGKKGAKKYIQSQIKEHIKDEGLKKELQDYATETFAKKNLNSALDDIAGVLAKEGVEGSVKQLKEGMIKATAQQTMLNMSRGTMIGHSFVQNSGELFTDLVSRGQDTDKSAWTAVTTGSINAYLDTWLESKVLGKIFGENADTARKIARDKVRQGFENVPGGFKGIAAALSKADAGRNVGFAALAEGTTEAIQEAVNMVGIEFADPDAEFDPLQITVTLMDAFTIGGLAGGGFGGASAWSDYRDRVAFEAETLEVADMALDLQRKYVEAQAQRGTEAGLAQSFTTDVNAQGEPIVTPTPENDGDIIPAQLLLSGEVDYSLLTRGQYEKINSMLMEDLANRVEDPVTFLGRDWDKTLAEGSAAYREAKAKAAKKGESDAIEATIALVAARVAVTKAAAENENLTAEEASGIADVEINKKYIDWLTPDTIQSEEGPMMWELTPVGQAILTLRGAGVQGLEPNSLENKKDIPGGVSTLLRIADEFYNSKGDTPTSTKGKWYPKQAVDDEVNKIVAEVNNLERTEGGHKLVDLSSYVGAGDLVKKKVRKETGIRAETATFGRKEKEKKEKKEPQKEEKDTKAPLTAADLRHNHGEDFSFNNQWVITYPDGSTDLIFRDSDHFGSHHAPWYLVKKGELKEGEESFEYLGFTMKEAKQRLAEKRNQQEGRVPQEEQPQTPDEDPRWVEAEQKLREAGGLSKEEQVVPENPDLGVTLEDVIGAPQKAAVTRGLIEGSKLTKAQRKETFESLPEAAREGIQVEDGTPASILSAVLEDGRSFYLIKGSDSEQRTLVEMQGGEFVSKETLAKIDKGRTETAFFTGELELPTRSAGRARFIRVGEGQKFRTLEEAVNEREPNEKNYLIRRRSPFTSIHFVYQGTVDGQPKVIFVPVDSTRPSKERAEDRGLSTLDNFSIDTRDSNLRTYDRGSKKGDLIREKKLFRGPLERTVEKTGRIVLPGGNGPVVVRDLKPLGVAVGKGYLKDNRPPIRYVDPGQLKDFLAFEKGERRDTTPTGPGLGWVEQDIVPSGETAYAEVADLIPDELSPAQKRFLGDALKTSRISRDEAAEAEDLFTPLADLMEKAATEGGANKTIINDSVAAWLRVGDLGRTSEVLGELEELLNEKTTGKKLESFFQNKQTEAEVVLAQDRATEQEQAPPTDPNVRSSAAPIETQNELHHEEVQRHVEKVSKILGTIGVEVRSDLPNTQEGYFDPDTRKIVINANLKKERATKVILHELSHRGMSYLFSRDKRAFGKFLLLKKSLEKSHANELSALAKKYYAGKAYGKLSKWEQAVAVEEFIAKQAEGVNTPQGRALWTRIKDALIDMLKVFDPTPTWSDRDIRQFALESVGNGMRTPLQESTGDGSQVRSSSRAIWADPYAKGPEWERRDAYREVSNELLDWLGEDANTMDMGEIMDEMNAPVDPEGDPDYVPPPPRLKRLFNALAREDFLGFDSAPDLFDYLFREELPISQVSPQTKGALTSYMRTIPATRYSLAEGIPVFHGSETEGLLSFDTDPRSAYGGRRVQMGAHFGTTLDQAKHAHVTEARITLRNPLRLPDVGIWKFDTVFPLVKDNLSKNNLNLFEMLDSPKNRENGVLDHALQRALVQNGYDGIVYENQYEGNGDSYIVFNPESIQNPATRYSLAEGTDTFSDGFEAPLDTYDMVREIEETEKRVSAETAVLIATDLQQVLANVTQSVYPEDLKRAQQFVSTKVNRATLAASETDTSVPLHERIYAERQGKITAKRVSALIALQKRFLDTLADAKLDPTDPRAIALQEAVGRITSKVEDIQDTLRRVEYVPGPENGQGTVFQIPKAGDSDATFMSKKRTMKIGKDASTETYEGAVIRLYEYILNKESKGETDDIAYSMAVSQHNYLVDAKIGGFDDTLANSQIGGLTLGLMAEAEQLNLSGTKEGKEAAKLLNRHGSQRKLAHGQLYKLVNRAARSVVSAMDRFSMDRQQVLALLERVMHVYERDTTLAETQFSPDQLSARRARIAYNELRNDPAFTLPDTDEIRILKTIDDLARSQAEISRTLKEWNVEEGLYVEDTFRKFNPATQKWESVKGTRKHLPAGPLTFSRRMSDELRGIATSTIQEGQETNTAIINMGLLTELLETNPEGAGAAAVELITKDPNLLRLFEISRSRGSRLYKNRQGATTKPILELPTGSPEEFFDELVATHGGEVTDYIKDLVGFFRQARSAVAEIKGGMTPPSRNDTTLDTGLAVSGAMSHARSDQEWPSEAYEFNIFTDMKDLQVRTNSIAAFRSWGRDGSRLTNVLEALKIKAVRAKNEILSKLPGVRIDKHILKNPEAKAIFGDRLTTLYSEAKLEKLPDKVVRNLNTYFVRYDSGSEEMGRWRQFFNWTVNGMLQNPGTAIQSLNEIFPFFQEGLSARSIGKFGSTVKNLFLEGFAKPLAITFGMKPDKSSALREFEEATGATLDAESQRTFRDILAPVTSSYGKLPGETFEKMTELTRKAIGSHDGQAGIRPIAPFTHVVESVRKALILSNFSTVTKDITQLINYYESGGLEQYPPGFADGAVRQEALNRFAEVTGMELSLYAKRAVANKAAGKPMFDRRMWVGLMDWTATQQGETHIGNLPMGLMSGAPGILSSLYKWTFVRGNELNRKRFNSKGEREQVGAWLSKYLLMVAPTLMGGIGANWLRELYMERILQKRRNKRQLEEMFTGELDDFFLGAAEQTAASGVFGYWGDILDATFNVATGDASYQGLSLDKKIIAASQVQSLFNAARFMVASGGADYSHVGRPLLNTIGMSSMIHTLHTVDRIGFELFDWEQNTARRGHVANTLSVWGRIMGYENKSFYGGAKPTPKSRALTRLEFAIYEDNIEEFKAAWKAALKSEIATGEVKSYKEAEQKLRTSLRGRHPLKKGFRTLYKQDYVNLLNKMDSGSRATTEKAVALWNKYLVAVGSSGFVGSE